MLNGSEFPELPALVSRYGGSQIPDKWLKECRYNQAKDRGFDAYIKNVEMGLLSVGKGDTLYK